MERDRERETGLSPALACWNTLGLLPLRSEALYRDGPSTRHPLQQDHQSFNFSSSFTSSRGSVPGELKPTAAVGSVGRGRIWEPPKQQNTRMLLATLLRNDTGFRHSPLLKAVEVDLNLASILWPPHGSQWLAGRLAGPGIARLWFLCRSGSTSSWRPLAAREAFCTWTLGNTAWRSSCKTKEGCIFRTRRTETSTSTG